MVPATVDDFGAWRDELTLVEDVSAFRMFSRNLLRTRRIPGEAVAAMSALGIPRRARPTPCRPNRCSRLTKSWAPQLSSLPRPVAAAIRWLIRSHRHNCSTPAASIQRSWASCPMIHVSGDAELWIPLPRPAVRPGAARGSRPCGIRPARRTGVPVAGQAHNGHSFPAVHTFRQHKRNPAYQLVPFKNSA